MTHIGAAFPASFLDTPVNLLTVFSTYILALWIARSDPWLGIAVAWVSSRYLWTPTDVGLAVVHWFALGAAGLTLARRMSTRWQAYSIGLLIASGIAQVVYATLQMTGVDPLLDWPNHAPMAVGTFGNVRYLGALVAVLIPLASPLAALALAVGLVAAKSWLAVLAATVGVFVSMGGGAYERSAHVRAVQSDPWRERGVHPTAALLTWVVGGAVVALILATRFQTPGDLQTVWTRTATWTLGLRDMWAHPWSVLVGFGPAGWIGRIPQQQFTSSTAELWLQAHNEFVQWFYEFGAVGLVILGGWLWTIRRAIIAPYAGALVSLFIMSLGLHIFHWPTLAPPLILLLGCALSEARPRLSEATLRERLNIIPAEQYL